VKLRPLLVPLCLLLLTGGLTALGVYGWQMRQVYLAKAAEEARVRERLATVEARLKANEAELERLRTDPAYVELQIRRRLGWARPDELQFRFEP
jgi:cell division protein DivIC